MTEWGSGVIPDPVAAEDLLATMSYAMRAVVRRPPRGTSDLPLPADDDLARAVLSKPGQGPSDRDGATIVDRWIDRSRRREPYPPYAVAMVGRVIHDPRVASGSFLDKDPTIPKVAVPLPDEMLAP